MGSEWSKKTFAKNLRYHMQMSGKTQKELAEIAGVSAPTFNEWINEKKYPRIDKIQRLADYFGILKSDLIEDKEKEEKNIKNSDAMADITVKMFEDEDFFLVVKFLSELDKKQFKRAKVSLKNLFEERFDIDID